MSAKQDRQGVRTPADLERKYKFGESFAEVMGIATGARKAAEEAQALLDKGMTQEQVFNILTNNGESQGLYRGEDGELYINASYIVAGILKSLNGATKFDLDDGSITCTSPDGNTIKLNLGSIELSSGGKPLLTLYNVGFGGSLYFRNPDTGDGVGCVQGKLDGMDIYSDNLSVGCNDLNEGTRKIRKASWKKIGGVPTLVGDADASGKQVLYSGSVASGSYITVPNTADYDLFAVRLGTADSTEETVVLAYKVETGTKQGKISGVGASTQANELLSLSCVYSWNTWQVVSATKQSFGGSATSLYVKEIIGVI